MHSFYLHPDYEALRSTWAKYQDFYDGDNERMKNYLIRFALEDESPDGKAAWNQRKNRTFYVNFCEPIISIWVSMLFKRSVDTSEVADIFTDQELDNIDGEGNSINTFIKKWTTQYLLLGKSYAFVDSPNVLVRNQADANSAGLRPYGQIWSPTEVPDWQKESINGSHIGKFTSIHDMRVELPLRASLSHQPTLQLVRRSFYLKDGAFTMQRFIAKTQDSTASSTKQSAVMLFLSGAQNTTQWIPDGEEKSISEVSEIPVTIMEDRSWLAEVIPQAHRYYNLDSNHDNIIYFNGYPRLAISTNQSMASIMPASESTVMKLPEGSTLTQISSDDPTASEKNRAEVRNMIFRIGLNQIRQLDGGSQAVQSADTIRQEKEFTVALAKETVLNIQQGVNSFVQHWAMFRKKKDYANTIKLNTDIGTDDVNEFIQLYNAFATKVGQYPETSKAMDKKLIEKVGLNSEDTSAIFDEIDNAEPAETSQTQRANILNSFVNAR